MKKYRFENFETDNYIGSVISNGQHGCKIEMSILNPFVSGYYREKLLDALNEFISGDNAVSYKSIDSVSGNLWAYIGGECIHQEMEADKKYALTLYVYNNEGGHQETYIMDIPILPTEGHFPEFKECVMKELGNMIFG